MVGGCSWGERVPLEHGKHRNGQDGAPWLKSVFEWCFPFPSLEASSGGAAKKGAKKKGSSFQTVSALFRVRANSSTSNYLRSLALEVRDHIFQETLEKRWRLWLPLIWNGRDQSDIVLSHLSEPSQNEGDLLGTLVELNDPPFIIELGDKHQSQVQKE